LSRSNLFPAVLFNPYLVVYGDPKLALRRGSDLAMKRKQLLDAGTVPYRADT